MSVEATVTSGDLPEESQKLRNFINKSETTIDAIGFGWLVPILRIVAGDNVNEQLSELRHKLLIPLMGLTLDKRLFNFKNASKSETKN